MGTFIRKKADKTVQTYSEIQMKLWNCVWLWTSTGFCQCNVIGSLGVTCDPVTQTATVVLQLVCLLAVVYCFLLSA